MDELAREYRETHDPEIPEKIYRLAASLKSWITKVLPKGVSQNA